MKLQGYAVGKSFTTFQRFMGTTGKSGLAQVALWHFLWRLLGHCTRSDCSTRNPNCRSFLVILADVFPYCGCLWYGFWRPKSPKTLSRTYLLHVSMFMEFSGINYIVSTVSLIALSHHSVAKNPWSNQHKKWWTRGTWIGCFQRVRRTRTKRSTWILSTHPWRGGCLGGPDDLATHGGRDFGRITWTN